MSRHKVSVHLAVVALVLGLAAVSVSTVHAAKPDKQFPEFAAQKSGLGTIALLTDVVVVEDVIGNTEKVYVEDCKRFGQGILQTFADGLGPKGYQFGTKSLVSVGHVVKPTAQYRLLQTWDQHKEDDAKFAVGQAPFYEDPVLCAAEGSRDAWHATLNGVWSFEMKKNKPAPVLADVAALRDSIHCDYALFVVVVGTKIPFGKQFGQGMLSSLTKGPVASSGNVTFSAGVDFTEYSGTGIRIAMVDTRNGNVLWADGDHEKKSLNDENIDKLAKDVLKRMP